MGFYNLAKDQSRLLNQEIRETNCRELESGKTEKIHTYFSDKDTYIRKAAYLSLGKIFFSRNDLRISIIHRLEQLFTDQDHLIR